MANKIRILFVVDSMYKAGTERLTFEMNKQLVYLGYDVNILSLKTLDFNHMYLGTDQYYYPKHLSLKSKIYFKSDFNILKRKSIFLRSINYFTCRIGIPLIKSKDPDYTELLDFFNNYDLIHWMGEYTVMHEIFNSIKSSQLISITSAKFQNPSIYSLFNKEIKYNFLSGYSDEEAIFEFSEFNRLNAFRFPLSIALPSEKKKWTKQTKEIKKISIFTRLNSYKPLDPFFYSLQLLQNKLKNTELHVFGYGDPELEGMNRYIDRIGLSGVFFRGNVESIYDTLDEEYFDLSWFQGYNNDRPAGYAGLDVASFGLPLICWDFHPNPQKMVNEIFPHFKNIEHFVNYSIDLILDIKKAEELSLSQFNEIKNNWDIVKNIGKLENIYTEIISEKS